MISSLQVSNSFLWRSSSLRTLSSFVNRPWTVDAVTGIVYGEKEPLFQTIIGLEIHAQLEIPTKLFSPAHIGADFGSAAPNTQLALLDVAIPGSLPVLSRSAVQAAVLAAAALNCEICTTSRFERKHYAYADLALGYQITQQRWPLAVNGSVQASSIVSHTKKKKKKAESFACRIHRIQLEQDTAKTTTSVVDGTTWSRVDFNRAGSALIEIVSEPDLRSSQQAVATIEMVRQLLKHVGVCNGKMQEGSLRVDLNVNLESLEDGSQRSPRVEVKNLNSLHQVQDAAEYEACRQAALWDTPNQSPETRTWNVPKRATVLIRSKDDEQDYRFLPEADLPPLVLNEHVLDGLSVTDFIRQRLPELPTQAVRRLMDAYGLSDYQAHVIAADPPAIRILDQAIVFAKEQLEGSNHSVQTLAQFATNLLSNELFALVKADATDDHYEASVQSSPVTGDQLGEIVVLLAEEIISSTMAKKLLAEIYHDTKPGASPRQIAADRGFQLIIDPAILRDICQQVVDSHPEEVKIYCRGGKFVAKMNKLFIGKAMAASRGNAHPERLREALQEVLDNVAPLDGED